MNTNNTDALRDRVRELEEQLQSAKSALQATEDGSISQPHHAGTSPTVAGMTLPPSPSTHNLMLLSDSALPLGSFAYSSGLESFLAHHRPPPAGETNLSLFQKFLKHSIHSVAYTNAPYALAAFRDPQLLMDLDNDLDASTLCNVARRASIAQGRALLGVWEKAFVIPARNQAGNGLEATAAIGSFSRDLKLAVVSSDPLPVNGHLAPLWGVVCLALGLNLADTGYLFLLNHAKAVMSAAVRSSVIGPYMAQHILAGRDLQDLVRHSLEKAWSIRPEDAGQVVPSMDLWIGRHEMLYSRIFNS